MKLNEDEIIDRGGITYEEALACVQIENEHDIEEILTVAGRLTRRLHKNRADLCSIVNAKSGLCSENCSFCAQSIQFSAQIKRYPLLDPETIIAKAKKAEENGAHKFCIVTSGSHLTEGEFKQLLEIVTSLRRAVTLQIDVSIGFLNDTQARFLKQAGVRRVNHNVQTSSLFYPSVATTHTYADRLATLKVIKQAELEICCGVILGMGETREDRIRAAFEIKSMQPECVPINLLDPRSGTPLERQGFMKPIEILKTIAVFRLILPATCLKLAGGRQVQLGQFQNCAFNAGINGLIIGEFLTTTGNPLWEDFKMLREAGLD